MPQTDRDSVRPQLDPDSENWLRPGKGQATVSFEGKVSNWSCRKEGVDTDIEVNEQTRWSDYYKWGQVEEKLEEDNTLYTSYWLVYFDELSDRDRDKFEKLWSSSRGTPFEWISTRRRQPSQVPQASTSTSHRYKPRLSPSPPVFRTFSRSPSRSRSNSPPHFRFRSHSPLSNTSSSPPPVEVGPTRHSASAVAAERALYDKLSAKEKGVYEKKVQEQTEEMEQAYSDYGNEFWTDLADTYGGKEKIDGFAFEIPELILSKVSKYTEPLRIFSQKTAKPKAESGRKMERRHKFMRDQEKQKVAQQKAEEEEEEERIAKEKQRFKSNYKERFGEEMEDNDAEDGGEGANGKGLNQGAKGRGKGKKVTAKSSKEKKAKNDTSGKGVTLKRGQKRKAGSAGGGHDRDETDQIIPSDQIERINEAATEDFARILFRDEKSYLNFKEDQEKFCRKYLDDNNLVGTFTPEQLKHAGYRLYRRWVGMKELMEDGYFNEEDETFSRSLENPVVSAAGLTKTLQNGIYGLMDEAFKAADRESEVHINSADGVMIGELQKHKSWKERDEEEYDARPMKKGAMSKAEATSANLENMSVIAQSSEKGANAFSGLTQSLEDVFATNSWVSTRQLELDQQRLNQEEKYHFEDKMEKYLASESPALRALGDKMAAEYARKYLAGGGEEI